MGDTDNERGRCERVTSDTQRTTDRSGIRRPDRRTLLGATGAALGTSLSGCLDIVRSSDDSEPVRVGIVTGGGGTNQITAANVAAEKLNDDGGILGRDVEVVAEQTGSSPLESRRGYHRLTLEDGVDVTMGVASVDVLTLLLDDIAEQERLHFTTGIGSLDPPDRITDDYERYKYHFRTGPLNNEQQIDHRFNFIGEMFPQLGWDSLALLVEDYPWTNEIIPAHEQFISQSEIEIASQHRYRPAREDFASIYDEIELSGADVAWVAMGHTGNDAITQWAVEQREFGFGGVHVPMQSPDYYDNIDGRSRYAFTTVPATPTSERTPRTQDFVEAFREKAGEEPIFVAYNMYDSFFAYREAVEAAGTFDEDAVIAELESIKIEGSSGMVSYYGPDAEYPHDREYDMVESGELFFQWQETDDGEGIQEAIWPEEHATGEYVSPPWV